jgi:Skp family chaperone for outer membrane proteins
MRTVRLAAASIMMAALFSVAAFAQTPAAGVGKIGLINTAAFGDEKTGITKFVTAVKSVNDEFKPAITELQTLTTRYQTLANEAKKLQEQLNTSGGPPINRPEVQKQLEAKIEEGQSLELTIKRKDEDLKQKSERRSAQVVGPIYNDITKALSEYAKKNGYAVILDGGKLEQAEILMGFDEKYDVTKDFITYFNTRPATTATTAKPQ